MHPWSPSINNDNFVNNNSLFSLNGGTNSNELNNDGSTGIELGNDTDYSGFDSLKNDGTSNNGNMEFPISLHDDISNMVNQYGLRYLAKDTGFMNEKEEIEELKQYDLSTMTNNMYTVPHLDSKLNFNINVNQNTLPLNQKQDKVETKKKKKKNPSRKTKKGLRHFSKRVCEKVESKNVTTYNEVAEELVTELNEEVDNEEEKADPKNIRRRVYDSLNVLTAMDIISKEKKIY